MIGWSDKLNGMISNNSVEKAVFKYTQNIDRMSGLKEEANTAYESTLTYYKEKVDALQKEREAWLAKLDECASRMSQKQQKHQRLRQIKNSNAETDYSIVHHTIARFDEELGTLNIDRQNQNLQFEEAEQLIKIRQLSDEFPVIAQKSIPCVAVLGGQIIENDLNLHSKGHGSKYSRGKGGKNVQQEGRNSKSQKQFGQGRGLKGQQSDSKKGNTKKTLQQIMKMQIIQTQKLNAKQILLMEEQKRVLEESIAKFKSQKGRKNEKQRGIVKQFEKKYAQLEKKHKQLAEDYFSLRRQHKQKKTGVSEESEKLKATYQNLEQKIAAAMKVYQKQNKAKQALILRKSEDFQEDYKAKMRAKERNLQALKQNYEKMQELCIEKVRKLQATVDRAKYQLQDAEQRRKFLVQDLRDQLRELEKRTNEQRIDKAKIDLRMKQKILMEQQRQEADRERQEKQRRSKEREELIKTAYKKTALPEKKIKSKIKDHSPSKQPKQKNGQKEPVSGKKQNKKRRVNNAEQSSSQDSLDISDLGNRIMELQKKIAKGEQDQN